MRTNLKTLGTLILLTALSSQAGVILQEDFTYADGSLTDVSGGKWANHSGSAPIQVVSGALEVSQSNSEDVNAALTGAPYSDTNTVDLGVAALYAKFTINLSTLPSGTTYFAHFKDDGTYTYPCRISANTTDAAGGSYRIGVANHSASSFVNVPTDLTPGVTYTVVSRYVLATGQCTIWINPTSETDAGTGATDASSPGVALATYAFRQASGEGIMTVDDLVVATSFADVVPASAGSNPPFFGVEPTGTNVAEGATIRLESVAGGDSPLQYQWYQGTSALSGANDATYTIPSAVVDDSGDYAVVAANSSGSITSAVATVEVSAVAVKPSINEQPASQSASVGDNVMLSVLAAGTEPLSYQWTFYGTNLDFGTAQDLNLYNVQLTDSGPYQVIIANSAGSITSEVATLTVSLPPATPIATLRAMVDPTTFAATNTTALQTAEGVVTTHNNLTGDPSAVFYMQDDTAGIAVYWAGGAANLPAAGDRVRITAPLSSFSGLLELAPTSQDNVKVLSHNNPLPTPKALPFDAQTDPELMESLEGSLVGVTNVFLDLSSQTFVTVSAGELVTNSLYETFPMYINANTDIPGQNKPAGAVTILAVLGQYDFSSPYDTGYQLIPSQFADILSAMKGATVRATNVFENLAHPSGLEENTLTENVLRPGEKLTMYVNVTDPDGASVTITPVTSGLPASASWITGNTTGTSVDATFQFEPVAGDAGVNYTVALISANGTVTTTNEWTIYVPTAVEQQIAISEFLANPSSSTNSPYFNPLNRSDIPTSSLSTYDEYVEIVNLSGTSVDLWNWSIADAVRVRHRFYNGAPAESLDAMSAIVVYGGPLNGNTPVLPVPAFPASESSAGLALNNTGSETITLRNASGYIVDRIRYTGDQVSGEGSLSRFPTVGNWFAPQAYVSVSRTTPGTQYDGAAWNQSASIPQGVSNLSLTYGDPLMISFPASTTQASTLWSAEDPAGPYQVVTGGVFSTTTGMFEVPAPPPTQQYYFITTQ